MVGRPREFDRDKALDTAVRLFWAQGYDATGTAQLADEMGIGRQSMYCAFGDKQDLYLEALSRYTDRQFQRIIDILDGPGTGLERIGKVLDVWIEMAEDPHPMGCLLANTAIELGTRNPAVARALATKLERRRRTFLKVLSDTEAEGQLPAGLSAAEATALLLHLADGMAVAVRTRGGAREVHTMVTSVRKLFGITG